MGYNDKENANPRADKSRRIVAAKKLAKKKRQAMHPLMGRKNRKRQRHAKTYRGQGR